MNRLLPIAVATLAFSAASLAQESGHDHAAQGDYAADRYFDPKVMAHAREMMREEMGEMRFSKVMLNLAEYLPDSKGDGYRWDAKAWYGGDIHRFVLRTEGEGGSDGVETADVQALYSRAVSRYTDLQVGLRQDIEPHGRTYASLGAQVLAPFWFDLEGALFLSTQGELLARAEGSYDIRLAQRVVLQPRVELNLAAQDTAATQTGSGLSTAEVGLRLRYEIRREFAPYVGVSWEKRFATTADYWKAAGESTRSTTFVAGLRAWF
ncbi:MAG: copper resistance protein B [Steroidobacteraceae bacterium]